jgi:hypothetical protein
MRALKLNEIGTIRIVSDEEWETIKQISHFYGFEINDKISIRIIGENDADYLFRYWDDIEIFPIHHIDSDTKTMLKLDKTFYFKGKYMSIAILAAIFFFDGKSSSNFDTFLRQIKEYLDISSQINREIIKIKESERKILEYLPDNKFSVDTLNSICKKRKIGFMQDDSGNKTFIFRNVVTGNELEGFIKYKSINIVMDKKMMEVNNIIYVFNDFEIGSESLRTYLHPHISNIKICKGNRKEDYFLYLANNEYGLLLDLFSEVLNNYNPDDAYTNIEKIKNTLWVIKNNLQKSILAPEEQVRLALKFSLKCKFCGEFLNYNGQCVSPKCPANPNAQIGCPICGFLMERGEWIPRLKKFHYYCKEHKENICKECGEINRHKSSCVHSHNSCIVCGEQSYYTINGKYYCSDPECDSNKNIIINACPICGGQLTYEDKIQIYHPDIGFTYVVRISCSNCRIKNIIYEIGYIHANLTTAGRYIMNKEYLGVILKWNEFKKDLQNIVIKNTEENVIKLFDQEKNTYIDDLICPSCSQKMQNENFEFTCLNCGFKILPRSSINEMDFSSNNDLNPLYASIDNSPINPLSSSMIVSQFELNGFIRKLRNSQKQPFPYFIGENYYES